MDFLSVDHIAAVCDDFLCVSEYHFPESVEVVSASVFRCLVEFRNPALGIPSDVPVRQGAHEGPSAAAFADPVALCRSSERSVDNHAVLCYGVPGVRFIEYPDVVFSLQPFCGVFCVAGAHASGHADEVLVVEVFFEFMVPDQVIRVLDRVPVQGRAFDDYVDEAVCVDHIVPPFVLMVSLYTTEAFD